MHPPQRRVKASQPESHSLCLQNCRRNTVRRHCRPVFSIKLFLRVIHLDIVTLKDDLDALEPKHFFSKGRHFLLNFLGALLRGFLVGDDSLYLNEVSELFDGVESKSVVLE